MPSHRKFLCSRECYHDSVLAILMIHNNSSDREKVIIARPETWEHWGSQIFTATAKMFAGRGSGAGAGLVAGPLLPRVWSSDIQWSKSAN